jgi:hypothetical protein
MKRGAIAAVAAGLLAAFVAVPVQGAEWCLHDPQLNIRTPHGSVTIYVTEGVLGNQHQAALASARTGYTTYRAAKDRLMVTVYDYIPTDSHGTFATEMIVSSKPFGSGQVYGSTSGSSGSVMTVRFSIDPKLAGG